MSSSSLESININSHFIQFHILNHSKSNIIAIVSFFVLFHFQLFTDGWFLAGMDEYLRIRLLGENKRSSKPGPTYVYLFAHKGQASFTEIFQGGKENFYGKWMSVVIA